MKRVLCLLGTRSDVTALAPLLEALRARRDDVETLPVAVSGQADGLDADAASRGVPLHRDLGVADAGRPGWEPATRVIAALEPLLRESRPDLVLVRGDGTHALAGALAGFGAGVPVVRVGAPPDARAPAGLPPEATRRLIERLASLSLAADAPPERAARALDAWLDARQGPGRALADFVDAALREIEEITPEEARRILEAPDREGWHFVDVREPDEFAAGHLPGAKSSPRGFLEVKADFVHRKRDPWFEDRGRKLILYCGGGHRSAMAARTLQEMGFLAVRSMAEGFTGWTQRDYPVER